MNREKRVIAENLLRHLPEIDQALDVLSNFSVTTYSLLVLQERLFEPGTGLNTIGNKSDFLAGANEVLKILDSLPDALESIRKEPDKK